MTTLHILSNPYGITDLKYRMDPFNIAIIKFINNMQQYGYNIIHYGHELSKVSCEHVSVIFENERHIINENEMFVRDDKLINKFNQRVSEAIGKNKSSDDIILSYWGIAQKQATVNHQELIICEPSIGYRTECVFAPYRAFTSYAQMHYFYGQKNMLLSPSWYDEVIPNAFTPDEFEFNDK